MGLLLRSIISHPHAHNTTWKEVSLHDMLGVVEYEQLPRLNFQFRWRRRSTNVGGSLELPS